VPPHGAEELKHPEPDFFVVGMKSYGRAPTFLLRTGYEQVRSVVLALTGDWEAARQIELVLPETGVCSSNLVAEDDDGDALACCTPASVSAGTAAQKSSCCGPAAEAAGKAACCSPAASTAPVGLTLANARPGQRVELLPVVASKPSSGCCG
jgi:hypothetical protein